MNAAPRTAGRWALPSIAAAQLAVTLDGTSSTIALPAIGADLGLGTGALTWILTGYTLVFGGFLLLGGRLGDIHGHRRTLVAGLLLFAVTAAARAVAPDGTVLLVARTLQGIGAALVAPAALALITSAFPAGPGRTRAYAVYAAASGAGAGVGLVVGGLLTGLDAPLGVDGWRLTFLAVVPVALVVAVLAPRVLPESPRRPGRLDAGGAVTGVLGLGAVVYSLTRAGTREYGWGDPGTVAALVAGAALLAAFLLIESRVAEPLLPLRLLADRARAAALTTMMCTLAGNFAVLFFLTQFVARILGFTPLQAGLAFLPMSLGVVAGSAVAGRLAARAAAHHVAAAGALLAAGGLLMLSRLSVDDGPAAVLAAVTAGTPAGTAAVYWTGVLPYLTLVALGAGAMFPSLTAIVMRTVAPADAGVAAGMLNTAMQIGGAVGLSALGTVALHASDRRAGAVREPLAAALPGALGETVPLATFTAGATGAFLVASVVVLGGALLVRTLGGPGARRDRQCAAASQLRP